MLCLLKDTDSRETDGSQMCVRLAENCFPGEQLDRELGGKYHAYFALKYGGEEEDSLLSLVRQEYLTERFRYVGDIGTALLVQMRMSGWTGREEQDWHTGLSDTPEIVLTCKINTLYCGSGQVPYPMGAIVEEALAVVKDAMQSEWDGISEYYKCVNMHLFSRMQDNKDFYREPQIKAFMKQFLDAWMVRTLFACKNFNADDVTGLLREGLKTVQGDISELYSCS